MPDGTLNWTELEFAGAAFRSGYNERRASILAREDLALLDAYYARQGTHFPGRSQIIEFGCELTRGSDWLSSGGPFVITDVVAPELAMASERLKTKLERLDVRLSLLRNRNDITSLPICDLFYSALSLKVVPPTTLAQILGLLLAKVAVDGVALLHVPARHKHYQLLLREAQDLHDLYVIPQWKLFELFERLGFSLILVQEDLFFRSSDVVYCTVLARRRG
jgi:hypothetical protein